MSDKRPDAAPPKDIVEAADRVIDKLSQAAAIQDGVASPPSDAAPVAPICSHCTERLRRAWTCRYHGLTRENNKDGLFYPEDAPDFDPFKEEPPTDADEPPWEGWFSCEDCNGWFCGQPTCYESGDEVCNGCAFCRAQKDVPEIPMADQDELEDIARAEDVPGGPWTAVHDLKNDADDVWDFWNYTGEDVRMIAVKGIYDHEAIVFRDALNRLKGDTDDG